MSSKASSFGPAGNEKALTDDFRSGSRDPEIQWAWLRSTVSVACEARATESSQDGRSVLNSSNVKGKAGPRGARTFVLSLLTFCPPLPPDRSKRTSQPALDLSSVVCRNDAIQLRRAAVAAGSRGDARGPDRWS